MKILKHFMNFAVLSILLFNASHLRAERYHQDTDRIFATTASRPELIEAYVNKCNENHHLAEIVSNARSYHEWKVFKKGFAIGVIVATSLSAIGYIITR